MKPSQKGKTKNLTEDSMNLISLQNQTQWILKFWISKMGELNILLDLKLGNLNQKLSNLNQRLNIHMGAS